MFSKARWRTGPWAVFGNGTAPKGDGKPKRKRTAAKPRPAPLPIDDIPGMAPGQRIVCSWPPVELSPNARVHWSVERRVAAAYRHDCFFLTLAAKVRVSPEGAIRLRLDLFPPNRARRDDDNAEAAFKHGRDGIAAALKVDDSRFRIAEKVWHTEPRACVVVTVLDPEGEPA